MNNALRLTAHVNDFACNKWHYYKAGDIVYLIDGPQIGPHGIPVARVAYWEELHTSPYDPPQDFLLAAHLLERAPDVPDRQVCHPSCCVKDPKTTHSQERERDI